MSDTEKIRQILAGKKKKMLEENPVCMFCGHGLDSENCDLAHIIPRSERIEGISNIDLQTMDENIGLAHNSCHDVFDNRPAAAVNLPRIFVILDRMFGIDQKYYNRYMWRLEPYWAKEIEKKPEEHRYEYRATSGCESYIRIFINRDLTMHPFARAIERRRRKL